MKSLLTLGKYFAMHRWRVLSGFLFILLANLFKTYNPTVVRNAVNNVTEKLCNVGTAVNGKEYLLGQLIIVLFVFLGTYVLVALMEGLFTFLMRQTIIVVSRLMEYDIKNDMYDHYQRLDLAFYRRNNTGDLMNRITEDVSRVRMFVGPSLMYSANLVCMFVLCTAAMIHVNWKLALFVLIPMPFLSLLIYMLNNRINKGSEELQAKLSDITTNAQESYSGIRVIQAYVQEKAMLGFFGKESDEYKDLSMKLARVESIYFPLITLLVGCSISIIVYVGGIYVGDGKITLGNIAEFIMYLNMLTFPVSALGWAVSLTQRAAVSMDRINHFMSVQPTVLNDGGRMQDLKGTIEFRHVDFVYPDTGIHALKDVSFFIPQGQRWAIVGRTGSGKSTLADLTVRMYDATKGEVLIDGINIREWNTGHLRHQMGLVPQDVFLFSESIKDNINFGTENSSMERAAKYAGYASIHEEIRQFPQGYDTVVGERGVTLSGGQKQRISIARALAKDPSILILDDCLSAVDAATEKRIEANLDRVLGGKTSMIITHRIFSLMHFDRILVLDEGRIAESGTHQELLSLGGIYRELHEKQAATESATTPS
ncbi:MAG: ABC transporter ATP-binding protein [Bacteroidetes bacterium]|nr:ABC transporter ATP-binding protein [Bacteroidota bacterium]